MRSYFRMSVLAGCLLAVPLLATVLRGEAEKAPPKAAKEAAAKAAPKAEAPRDKRPVKTLQPERAALGPVRIDPMPAPVVPADKKYARLPPYYSRVVDEKQRQRIYAIQRLFGPKLDEYKLKYEALKKQRDEKIEQILSDAQRTQIEQLKAAAKAKRAKAKK